MECNCNNNSNNGGVIPWVRGNRLPLIICVYEDVVTQEGEGSLVHNKMERVPYEIQAADTVTVVMKSGFRQVEMPFTTEGNKVLVTDNGELAAGTYTVEVTIVRGDGARGRWQETRQVRVYENTSDAQLGEMYAIEADLFFYAKGDTGNGIADITSNPDDTLTITMTDGTTYTTKAMRGEKGDKGDKGDTGTSIVSFEATGQTDVSVVYTVTFSDDTTQEVAVPKGPQGDTGLTGNGIASTTLNNDYTLTVNYTDGTSYTTPSIRGAQGVQGVSIIAFTQTGETATNTLYNVVFSDGRTQSVAIPKGVKGDKGDTGNTGPQGAQGPKGDTVIIGDEQTYTLYGVTGQNSDGAMTQKAVTDNYGYKPTGHNGYATNLGVGIGNTVGSEAVDPYSTGTEINVSEGDVILITAQGGNNSRAWGFIDEDRKLLSVADAAKFYEDEVLIAPAGADKVVLNAVILNTPGGIIGYPNYKWYLAKADSVGADAILSKFAKYTKYDNSQSRLAAENVQSALDEFSNNAKDVGEEYAGVNCFLYNDSGWKWQNLRAGNNGKFIPIVGGNVYRIVANTKATDCAFLTSNAHTTGAVNTFATGSTGINIPANTTKTLKAPANAKFLFVNTLNNGSDTVNPLHIQEVVIANNSLGESIEKLDEVSDNIVGATVDTSSFERYNGIVIDLEDSPAINWGSKNLEYTRHIVVPVLSGSLYELTANENRNSIIIFAKSYTPLTSYPSNVDYATGWEKRLVFNGTVKLHVPSDAKFMIASAVNLSNQDNTPTIRLLSSNERLTMLEDETAVYYPLDKSTYQLTSYLIKYDAPTQWQSVAGHDGYFIPILPLKKYKITANENAPATYAFLSSDSTSGNVQYALGWSSYEELRIGNSKEYISPYNAAYLWVHRSHTTQGDKTPYIDIEMSVDNAVDKLEGRVSVLEAETDGNTPNYIDLMKIGCAGDGVTDDTSLIQGAINTIVANGGGVIYGGRNVYKITQLVIPDLRPLQTNGKIITLELRGETPAMTIFGTVGSYQELSDSIRGTMMLKSDLNNGEAIIKYAGTDFCSSVVVLRNIQLRCYENPNCSGFNFAKLGKVIMQNVMIDTGIYGVNSIEPTHESYGIILPVVDNGAMTLLDNVLVSGFNYGVSMGEHADIRALSINECKKGIYFPSNFGYHSADVQRACIQRCTYPVYIDGACYFHISNLNIEIAGDNQYTEDNQWQVTINELYDPQSKGYGFIRWNTVKGMVGNVRQFSVNGGNNIVVKWIGEE